MVELKFSAGDEVKIGLAMKEVSGTILESYEKDVVLLKLDSGYNIGIPKDNIHGYKVVKKYKGPEIKYKKPVFKKGKPTIGMVVTGGTIASKVDYKTGGVRPPENEEEFASFYPSLFENYNVKVKIPFMIDSSSMSSDEWKKVAFEVKAFLDDKDVDGVIVTHGTDSLHYTSSALSFFLRDLNKPVVLTYSQRSIDRASSDAKFNLECAARFATSDCTEVVIVGRGSINDDFCYAMRGTKVRKLHSSRRDAFKPVNCLPIAKVTKDEIEFLESYNSNRKGKVVLDDSFSDKIALIKFVPGTDPSILDYYVSKGFKGIVIEMLGMGLVAGEDSKKSWIPAVRKAIKSGVVICAAAQTIYGRLNPNVYSIGRDLEKAGVIYLKDMLSETAFVKLGWVLGHRSWRSYDKIREKMLENVSGEFSEILSE